VSETLSVPEVTRILREISAGKTDAQNELLPHVYQELRKLAQSYLRKERENHTLQATEIVHEAYLKLVGFENINWQNRAQFFAIAATLMRRILVDYARERNAEKRGGEWQKVTLNEAANSLRQNEIDVIELNDALEELAKLDELQGKLVELRFFGGLTIEETAEALNISPATVKREWAMAKAFLYENLKR
jgi:RNA polymerase sigma-70 factor, ECF subfamily